MSARLTALGERFSDYLSGQRGEPWRLVTIEQIPGGASRETYRVRVARPDGSSPEGLILRRDPATSLIDTERALEFRTYAAVWPTPIPVPEPLLLEEDPRHLERPFSVTREVSGCQASPALLRESPYREQREALGRRKWSLLGTLAALDIGQLGVTDFMETPAHPAARELEYWAGVIAADAIFPQPIAAAAIRWLRRHLPAPGPALALVHGDYRSGNFLYDATGEIHAVLDWEMAHIGDPLEDLAWSLDPLWSWPDRDIAGALLPRDAAIAHWEAASGITVDRVVFRWWEVFASLKALAIWISSTEDFINGTSKEPILAMAGWPLVDRQNRILLDRLHPQSPHRYTEPWR